MLFKDIINSVYNVFSQDAYLNLTINNMITSKADEYTEHDKKIYVKVTSGVVENKLLLDYCLSKLIKGQRVKPFIKNALRVATYMISFMNTPNHYVVNEIVKVVKKEDFRASSFVNAILRRYINENIYNESLDEINKLEKLERLSILYSIDLELVKLLDSQYDELESILKPSMDKYNTYRINTLKTSVEEVLEILNKEEYIYENDGIVLKTKASLINHDLFTLGKIIPQDASSIKVGLVASPDSNSRVLDACSAPGAKSMHMSAIMNNTGIIYSCDVHEHKIKLIESNAKKLGVTNVKTMLVDSSCVTFDEEFDTVLLDVPCSGLGVINHKSDLKYKMTLEKIKNINALQKQILNNLSKYVKVNGHLVYSTCTINKDENERLIKEFLEKHQEFKMLEEHIIVQNYQTDNDGFYIAKLERI